MNSKPLTARQLAHPIRMRLARAGLPLTLAAAGVEGGRASGLRFPVVAPVSARHKAVAA